MRKGGSLCPAGQKTALIFPDGKVARCGQIGEDMVLGSFFDSNFKLLDSPLPCEAEYCPCDEERIIPEENEDNFLVTTLGDIDRIVYHLKGESPKGKLCNAGYKYAVIQADGKVIRCGQLADRIISNFLDENFHLLDDPEPCEADFCPCNEYVNLMDANDQVRGISK